MSILHTIVTRLDELTLRRNHLLHRALHHHNNNSIKKNTTVKSIKRSTKKYRPRIHLRRRSRKASRWRKWRQRAAMTAVKLTRMILICKRDCAARLKRWGT